MKIKNSFFSTSLFLVLLSFSSATFAQNSCADLFVHATSISRSEIVDFLVKNKLPAVAIRTENKDIPVILMNAKTAPAMNGFLRNSIGTVVAHQPGYNNDHGLLRISGIISDLDSPGYRNRGEIHQTGISWVNLFDYVNYGGRGKRIEVAYTLTQEEMKIAYTYAAMRRAAIVRAPFNFNGAKQDRTLPNFINAGEHCFIFCSSSNIRSQNYEIKGKFESLGLGTFDSQLQKSDIKNWLAEVSEKLWMVDAADERQLSPRLPMRIGVPDSLAKNERFQNLTELQKQEALNWLAAGHISSEYEKLVRTLGFENTGNGFDGMHNPRASAVLIYDATVSANDFVKTSYESPGIFSTWSNRNTKPLTTTN